MISLLKNKKILIGIIVVVIAFIAYGAIFVAGKPKDVAVVTQSLSNNGTGSGNSASAVDAPGKDFVAQLLAIQSITFDLSLFGDPVYQNLHLNNTEINPQPQGRDNPFLPFDSSGRIGSSDAGAGMSITSADATTGATHLPTPASSAPSAGKAPPVFKSKK